MVSVGKESERGLAESLRLKLSHEDAVKQLARTMVSTKVSTGGMGQGGASFSKLIHTFSAGPLGLPAGLPHTMEAGFHQGEWS